MSNIKGENITKDPICVLLSVVDHISFFEDAITVIQCYSKKYNQRPKHDGLPKRCYILVNFG